MIPINIIDIIRILQNTVDFSVTPTELPLGKTVLYSNYGDNYNIRIEIDVTPKEKSSQTSSVDSNQGE